MTDQERATKAAERARALGLTLTTQSSGSVSWWVLRDPRGYPLASGGLDTVELTLNLPQVAELNYPRP